MGETPEGGRAVRRSAGLPPPGPPARPRQALGGTGGALTQRRQRLSMDAVSGGPAGEGSAGPSEEAEAPRPPFPARARGGERPEGGAALTALPGREPLAGPGPLRGPESLTGPPAAVVPAPGPRPDFPQRLANFVEDLAGYDEWHRRRSRGPEANARITALTGLVLLVLLAGEALTILSINRFVFWHLAIGLVLVPVVALKLASTGWRFLRYYLGSDAYRRAGPPHPVLRALGPVLYLSTLALFASGILLFFAGPGAPPALYWAHKASFVVWGVAIAIHVSSHIVRAFRFARRDATWRRRGHLPHARLRQGLVVLSVALGLVLLLASRSFAAAWAAWGGFK